MNLEELKHEIVKNTMKGYPVKTNFSSCEFFVEIGDFIIIAKPICIEQEVKYEFMLDVQFLSHTEINYEEIIMIKNIIDILNKHNGLATSRLKKWTVEEYLEDKKQSELERQQIYEMLKNAFPMATEIKF